MELLQEVIANYDGTVLIVSHDRDFLDRTITTLLAFEGDAKIVAHAGGYSDYLGRRHAVAARQENASKSQQSTKKMSTFDKPKSNRLPRLSYKDQHILNTVPALLTNLDAQIAHIETALMGPDLFTNDPAQFDKLANQLAELKAEKIDKEEAWLVAAEKAEAIAINKQT